MTDLRKAAKGQPCTVNLPGVCNYDSSTTVLAHDRKGWLGMGCKPPDDRGAFCCSVCHDYVDGRRSLPPWLTRDAVRRQFEAGIRTTRAMVDGW